MKIQQQFFFTKNTNFSRTNHDKIEQKTSVNILSILFLFPTIAAYTYSIFYYPFSFNFEISVIGSYWILCTTFVQFLFYIFYRIFISKIPFYSVDVFLGLLFISTEIALSIHRINIATEQVAIAISLLMVYMMLRPLAILNLKIGLGLFLLFYFIELFIVTYQWIIYKPINDAFLFFTGTLHNSGIFACFIIVNLPLSLYTIRRCIKSPVVKKALCFVIIIFSLFVLYITRSRTADIVFFVLFITSVFKRFQHIAGGTIIKFFKYGIVVILIVIAADLLTNQFSDKQLSTEGRQLILKISSQHMGEHFWFGIGLGNVSLSYPNWQIEFFKSTLHPPQAYLLSAGISYLLFNEFFQLFIETGFLGFLIFSTVIIRFFTLKSLENSDLLKTLKYTVFAILLCCFTSYPLHVVPIMLLLVFSLVAAFSISDYKQRFVFYNSGVFLYSLIIIIGIYPAIMIFNETVAIYKWRHLSESNNQNKVVLEKQYGMLYKDLHKNGKFLLNYGQFLLESINDRHMATAIINESLKYHIAYSSYESLAETYLYCNDTVKAIHCYQTLSFLIPSRFSPRYRTILLLQKTGKINDAKKEAKKLLDLPIKFPSTEITVIRAEMKHFLNSH